MKFKVDQSHQLHVDMMNLKKKMKEANAAAFELAEQYGFDRIRLSDKFTIAGGISSFHSYDAPDGFKKAYATKSNNDFYPKDIKKNKELLEKIALLPVVHNSELNDLLNYDWRANKSKANSTGGSYILFTPGIVFASKKNVLISFPDYITKYKPVDGMIEITSSEYNSLNNH